MRSKSKTKIQMKLWIIPGLILLLVMLELFFPYKGWWVLLIAFSLMLTYSILTIRANQKHLSISRQTRFSWARVGDILEERIRIENDQLFGVPWLQIIDHTNIPGIQKSIGTSVNGKSTTLWRTKKHCTRRGLYQLGPTTIRTSDIFGVFSLEIHDPASSQILITPPVIPLPQITVSSGGQTGDGKKVQGILEQSVMVRSIRDYLPNDPLNHIHWPITAKRGKLTTRTFENTPTGNWWILQDMNTNVQFGSEQNNTLEVGIILAASLANKGLKSGKAVGFIANNQQKSWLPPQAHGDQNMKILKTLALSKSGTMSLKELLVRARSSFHQPASLIIITSDISQTWLEPLLWLKKKGLIPTLIMLDPRDFGGKSDPQPLLMQLRNNGIQARLINASLFEDQLNVTETPLWEWRVFGTGYAIPIKKPENTHWKTLT